MTILVESTSIGNYNDAQECATSDLRVESEDLAKDLNIADGSIVKTEASVRVNIKCSAYKDTILALIFPKTNKQMMWEFRSLPQKHID